MELKNLIDEKNEALYNRVATHFPVQFELNEDWRADAWTSYIENNVAYIKYCEEEIEHPKAALTHELLYLDLRIKGFKRIFTGISLNKKNQSKIQTLVKCLDYEFRNHRIEANYTALGYAANQFYGDENELSEDYFLDILNEESYSLMSISILYLNFITPFGGWSKIQKERIQEQFDAYQNGDFQTNFQKINQIINEWKTSKGYDATSFFIDFCKNIGLNNTWISYEKTAVDLNETNFPSSGFFIENAFTLKDIQKFYNH